MTHITVNSLTPALGAEISNVDLHSPISPATLTAIKLAWDEHLVLRFRGQKLSDQDGFVGLGNIDPSPGYSVETIEQSLTALREILDIKVN